LKKSTEIKVCTAPGNNSLFPSKEDSLYLSNVALLTIRSK